ncbi:MAG: TatD family hydrolase [Bacteroidales bacterium]|jgi:TatD DNase family protein|nr:TatD family hydrolase [Bacteroidales bacterium]
MQLIDTHTHLYLPEFDPDRDEMIRRAQGNGVEKLLMPNIDVGSLSAMLNASSKYPGICIPMLGLHPTSVKDDYGKQIDKLEKIFDNHRFIAIGEIGIDLYWDKTHIREQLDAMKRQLAFALKAGLPVVIHSRESFPEVFSVLDDFEGSGLKGVLHAFSGTLDDALKAAKMGFMLGIGGPITFKNSRLDEIVREVGLEHIVLETDSPYLAPVPYRGKRNESSYLTLINRRLAEIFNVSEEESAGITYHNSCHLFKI